MDRRFLRYCAIGDSLTVGVGSTCFVKGFITRYLSLTRKTVEMPIFPSIFGKSGATSGDILNNLNHPFISTRVKDAEIITITAGGNDLIGAAKAFLQNKNEKDFLIALENGKKNLSKIINRIMNLKHSQGPYIIRMINLYNPFPNIAGADKWVEEYNHNIERLANPPIIQVANIHDLFHGKEKELLAHDHIHPNNKGYLIIANALFQLGYEPLIGIK
ncbi:GDSL-type esterase/lipase family protein [Heyndrickxia sp. NPDC080065]|uniref:GDSL-type esterase/lipase family protein n=1 Tax=Heyndrickxia sp. NPDC080065 TaxID=3390568 RepID=UPI003D0604A5